MCDHTIKLIWFRLIRLCYILGFSSFYLTEELDYVEIYIIKNLKLCNILLSKFLLPYRSSLPCYHSPCVDKLFIHFWFVLPVLLSQNKQISVYGIFLSPFLFYAAGSTFSLVPWILLFFLFNLI